MKDKMGQEIEVGMWVIKPWDKSFDLGKVIELTPQGFRYEYTGWNGKKMTSLCKVPERCLAVPEILANYWEILK